MVRLAVKIALALDVIILMWLLSMLACGLFTSYPEGIPIIGGSCWPTSVFLSDKYGGDKLQLGPDELTTMLAISTLLLPVLVMLLRRQRKRGIFSS